MAGEPNQEWVDVTCQDRDALVMDDALAWDRQAHPRTDAGRVVTVWTRNGAPVLRDFIYLDADGAQRRCRHQAPAGDVPW